MGYCCPASILSTHRRHWLAALVLGLVLLSGCAAAQDQTTAAQTQITAGTALYATHCARCHGDQGQGKRGPPLIGSRHGLRGYGTAERLFQYTSRIMPFDAAGTLTEAEYWAIIAFLLQENQLMTPGTLLDGSTASAVSLQEPSP